MKTLEREKIVEKWGKNEGVPTKLLLSQLPCIINLKTWYIIKVNVIFL